MTNMFKPPAPQIIQQAPPPAPVVAPPAPIPDSQSPAVLEAAKRAQTSALSRAGRSSTILTVPGNRGGDFTGRTLG